MPFKAPRRSRATRAGSARAFAAEAGRLLLFAAAMQGCAHAPSTPASPVAPPGASAPGPAPGDAAPAAVARALLDDLARQDWSAAVALFDSTMARAMPEAKLRDVWTQVQAAQGDWRAIERTRVDASGPVAVVLVDVLFAKHRQEFRVAVDAAGKVAGFFRGPVPADAQQVAVELVRALARGDAAAAVARFDAGMRGALTPERAIALWRSLERKAGPLEEIERVPIDRERGLLVAFLRCRMARETVVVKVVFDADGDVAGLFFLPGEAGAWSPPPYADPALVAEVPVGVGSQPELPGSLTLPRRHPGPVPGIVLLHGSGPSDRDETMGGTKVFRDLALGLATRGMAVLRYEKRTRVDPTRVRTIREEAIEPALAALPLLRSRPEVDRARLVVIGHSQGGALAPLVAKLDGSLAGVVLFAAPAQSLQDSLVRQFRYLSGLHPGDASLSALLAEAERFRSEVDSPDLRPDMEISVPGGGTMDGAYFLDLRGYDPEKTAAALDCPILVLQGERDYQVTARDDFARWTSALAGRPRVTSRLYPGLDHRFAAGAGPSSPVEYQTPAHVDGRVIEDIAAWVVTQVR